MSGDKLLLVVNSGSSSLKFKLFRNDASEGLTAAVGGLVERIGDIKNSRVITSILGGVKPEKTTQNQEVQDHVAALGYVLQHLESSYSSDIHQQMEAVGHRVVHGMNCPRAELVTDSVLQAIKDAAPLAPLHNPANLQGITAASAVFSCPQVAVFDTAFHQTMPPRAYTYALPHELAEKEGLRRYGAHGTSYRYLVEATSRLLSKPVLELNLIICHLGAGASMAAIAGGRSIDTTMGLTPLEGLMMGTRSGDIDPSVVLYLQEHCGMTSPDVDKLLNKQSGFLGLTGSADLRSVIQQADAGSSQAQLAIEVFVHRVRKYLGAFLVELEGNVDAIVFSAGIGENNALVRRLSVAGLERFGIQIDTAKNDVAVDGTAREIQAEGSCPVLVVPTDEELSIAQQTREVVMQTKSLSGRHQHSTRKKF